MKDNLLIIFCWLFPLILGIMIFIIWVVFRIDQLMIAGIFTLYLGLILFFLGVTYSLYKIYKYNQLNKISEKKKVIKLVILNILNLPIAIIIIFLSWTILTGYTVQIQNESIYLVENCIIQGGGVDKYIGAIKPGESKKTFFLIKYDGSLFLKYEQNSIKNEILIDGYVTNSMGGNKAIKIE